MPIRKHRKPSINTPADVTEFLTWAADPKMEARKSMGVMTLIYLVILCILLYWSYRRIWADVKK